MAYAIPPFGHQQTQRDAKITGQRSLPAQPYLDDDDSAILDPAILDADIMHHPSDRHQLRKGSLDSNGVLSPAESEGWVPHYAADPSLEPASAGGLNIYHPEQHHTGYHPRGAPHASAYAQHQHPRGWPYGRSSGPGTPAPNTEFPGHHQQHFEGAQYAPHQHRTDSARGSFSHAMPPLPPAPALPYHVPAPHSEPSYIPAPQVQTPMSPHCHQDWMNLAQQEVEARPMSKRMRPTSPRETNVDFQRRDGIRKKNGRIDIPHERNIESIDQLIDSTTDESMLKELKQQKRLLRNREAALASRQRKKKHTEDLESREKEFNRQMGNLHEQLQALNVDRQKLEHDHGVLFHQFEEQRRINEALELEKRDMVMKHSEETSSLRRKIQVLEKDLDSRPELGPHAPPMSAEPSSSGFTEINGDLEALNMGPEWDSLFFNDVDHDSLDAFSFDTIPDFARQPPAVEKKSSSSTIVPSPPRKTPDTPSDQPIASGLLFFLLLCGAFVASKPASSRPADLPQVPPDVRAAAPKVLDNLLADNSPMNTHSTTRRVQVPEQEPAPSRLPHSRTKSRGRLDQVHQRITSPTKQQEIDAAAALTPAQYASITNMDAVYAERPSARSGARPSLAEALAGAPEDEMPRRSKAEVYTRSLLWEQIPPHVVQQFREVIRDHHELEARRQPRRPGGGRDDVFGFKAEP